MSIIRRGTLEPLRQQYEEHWSPTTGQTVTTSYRGFDETRMRLLAGQFQNAGISTELADAFGVWTLKAIDTTGEVTIDKWEVNVDEEQPSALQNPRHLAAIGTNAREILEVIGQALKDGSSLEDAAVKLTADTGTSYPAPPYGAEATRLYNRMKAGQTQYQKSNLILRHTTNAPARWQSNIADLGVNMLYSHAKLLTECKNAALWIYPLPGALEYSLTYFYNNFAPAAKSYYSWSWLKSASPRVTVANNRVDIATQFKLDQWSTDEYAAF